MRPGLESITRRRKPGPAPRGAPAWVVTYGDMMSLLLAFFVLLLSLTMMDDSRRFDEAIISIQGAFGVLPKNLTAVQVNPLPIRMTRPPKESEEAARRVSRQWQVTGQGEAVQVQFDKAGGLRLRLPASIFFEPGQSEINAEAFPALDAVAGILAELPEAFFDISGHTDNAPVSPGGPFADNFDLSYARAKQVMIYFQRDHHIPAQQFRVTGAGASEPVAPNVTPEGRRLNDRVEIRVRGFISEEHVRDVQERIQRLS